MRFRVQNDRLFEARRVLVLRRRLDLVPRRRRRFLVGTSWKRTRLAYVVFPFDMYMATLLRVLSTTMGAK